MFCACDGLQVSDNGDLDGMWHLVKVDSLFSSTATDYTYNGIYWSFQSDLLGVDDKLRHHESCLLRFRHENSTLIVSNPYVNNREEGDIRIDDVAKVAPFGINGLEEEFAVEDLSRKKLVLRSSVLRLFFNKN